MAIILAFFNKYWLYALLVIALFGGGWYALSVHDTAQQEIGANRVQVAWDAQVIIDRKAVTDRTVVLEKEKTDAELKAKVRIDAANSVALAASTSSRVLSSTLQSVITASATASVETNRKYVSTLSLISGECQDEYRKMAQAAQGHYIDSLKYQEAWPK